MNSKPADQREAQAVRWGMVGAVATGAWTIYWAAMVLFSEESSAPTKLNEWGDFLAGICGPVAFLWLVLGYRQNTAALALQAKELRASVAAQEGIMAATSKQINESARQFNETVTAQNRASQPVLQIECVPSVHAHDENFYRWRLRVTNHGERCTQIVFYFEVTTPHSASYVAPIYVLRTNAVEEDVFCQKLRIHPTTAVRVCYRDKFGVPRAQRFTCQEINSEDGDLVLWFRPDRLVPVPKPYRALVEGQQLPADWLDDWLNDGDQTSREPQI